MIHQPVGSLSEVATGEFILEVGELLKLRETLTRVYVHRTGKPLWGIVKAEVYVKIGLKVSDEFFVFLYFFRKQINISRFGRVGVLATN